MQKQPTARTPKAARLSAYANQWDRDAQAQRRDNERYARQWDQQARKQGNPNA